MKTSVSLPKFSQVVNGLKDIEQKDIDKAIRRTVSDCRSRAPAQVTKAVTAVYGIKSSEVTEAGKAAKGKAKTVGSIKVKGITIDNMQLVYSGRVLTPTHFSMTPKKRPEGGRKYKVKAGIYKGQKKALGTAVFLAPSGSAGTTEIPFRRTTEKRYPIDVVKTVSIPQMITNEKVAADIQARMDELLATRFEHNIARIKEKQ